MADEPTAPSPEPNASPGGSPEPTPPPVVAPAAAPAAADWRDSIPPEYTQEKVWEPYKDKPLGEVLKAHAEQVKLLGRSITLPGKDAKPEDLAKWKETQLPKLVAAGLVSAPPTAPNAYDLTQPTVPNIPPFNPQRLDFYKDGFHKLGLTQAQAQGLLDLHAQDLATLMKNADASNLAIMGQLQEEWGDLLFDKKWDKAVSAVGPIAQMAGMEPAALKAYFDATRKGNDPMMFRVLAAVGEMISEDSSIGIEVAGVSGPTQAGAEIERIRASEAFKSERHPGHDAALKRLEDLYKLRDGVGKALPLPG